MRPTFLAVGVLSIVTLCLSTAHAGLINGGFETPDINSSSNIVVFAGSPILVGWQISGGSGIDLVSSLWAPSEGSQSISLNWINPTTISQQIATTAGQQYSLSFDMAAEVFGGAALRTMDVLWNNSVIASPQFSYTGQGPTSMGWVSFSYSVIGTGSDTLAFRSTTTNPANYGPALDNVRLDAVSAVPEPGSLILFGLGALGLFGAARKRRNSSTNAA